MTKFYVNNAPCIQNKNCQISVKSAKANNSYSDFCEITKTLPFQVFVDDVRRKDLKLECFRVISQKPL